MDRSNSVTFRQRATSTFNKAAIAGTALVAAAPAFAIDVAEITTEISAAKTAGMVVLGAMILAGLAFKAWKLLKRA